MTKTVKVILIATGISLFLAGFFVVDQFFFPLTASPPYFSDVEAAFKKIQIPPDWQQIESSENRGIRGKRCPIESESTCFSKSSKYAVGNVVSIEDVKKVFQTSGCPVVSTNIVDYKDMRRTAYNLVCTIDGLTVEGTFSNEGGKNEVSLHVSS